jgi:replicative DNA helicase
MMDALALEATVSHAPGIHYHSAHRTIHRAIAGLVEAGKAVDMITTHSAVHARGDPAEIGGCAYLEALILTCPSAANYPAYLDAVLRCSRLRCILDLTDRLADCALAGDDPKWLIRRAHQIHRKIIDDGWCDVRAEFERD